jgi:hypothetical protein
MREPLRTHLARKGLLASVGAEVPRQVGFPREPLLTHIAPKGLLATVRVGVRWRTQRTIRAGTRRYFLLARIGSR